MNHVPLRYAHRNILFAPDGRAAAMYRLPTVSYALLPSADKKAWKWTVASLALATETDVSVYRVQRRWPAHTYVDQAAGLVAAGHNPVPWRRLLEGHRERLDALESHLPEVYLRVALPTPDGTDSGFLGQVDRWARRASGALGYAPAAPITDKVIRQLQDAEDLVLDAVRRSMPGTERMTTRQLQWLCRRAAVRHVTEPVLDDHWRSNAMRVDGPNGDRVFEPRDSDFLPLFNAPIHRANDHIVVDGPEVSTYQSFFTLGILPTETAFPGSQAELLFAPLENLAFPVDAVIHCRWMPNPKALVEVNHAIVDAENALSEATTGHHRPDDLQYLHPELARALKTYLQGEDRPPMLEATVSYAIAARDLTELRHRAAALTSQFSNVTLHHPAGLHHHLYLEHLPSAGGGSLPDYDQMLTVEQFGMLMPVATRDVGSLVGPYVGYTLANGRPRSPVKTNLLAAAADSLPTSIYMAGRQGSGKTFTAQFLAWLAAMRGSYVITADPSPDHNITRLLPDDSEIIGLEANARYRGMLDPLVVTPPELREEIAIDYYLGVLESRPGWETELTRSVRDVVRSGSAGGSLAVLEHLEAGNATAGEVAEALRLVSDFGLGMLAFGDGTTSARAFKDIKRITTITMGSLPLPGADVPRGRYGRSERMAVATFRLVAAYIMWLVTHDKGVHKVVVLDEAWALPPDLLDKLVRLGRKFNCTVIICSQTISDLGELKKLIGMYFIFGVNSPEEASLALDLIGLDANDGALCAKLADKRQFAKGRCLHRDLDGRVADMQIDAVYEHIRTTLSTEPRSAPPPDEEAQAA